MQLLRYLDRQAAANRDGTGSQPDREGRALARVAFTALQLALLILVVLEFRLEHAGFRRLAALVLVGFVVHSLLPMAQRVRFLLLISLAGIVLVLEVAGAAWLIGFGVLLAALCHLPCELRWRVAALTTAGAALAAVAWFGVGPPSLAAIWPIVGSMFMFRAIIYLLESARTGLPPSPAWTFSYLFLLPNACFPLFPVIGYERFRRSHYASEPLEIYQRGIHSILRGVVHLLLFRVAQNVLLFDPRDIHGAADLIRHLIIGFFLFLQITGRFHIVVGILRLFGFDLPRPHRLFFLASSLPDFWRRVNVYWKDFVMEYAFYPAVVRFRRLGRLPRLALATAFAFFASWLFHAYQWFWLEGSLLVAWQDAAFWAVAALLVVAGLVCHDLLGRKRRQPWRRLSGAGRWAHGLRVVATFSTMAILWSFWNGASLEESLARWSAAGRFWILAIAFIVGLHAAAALIERGAESPRTAVGQRRVRRRSFAGAVATSLVSILLLAAIGSRTVQARLGPKIATTLREVRDSGLNQQGQAHFERGYYRDIQGINDHNLQLWRLYERNPWEWKMIHHTSAWEETSNVMLGELVPGAHIVFKGKEFSVNRWSMRDRDYSLEKPAGVCRIALLGSSHVLGSGVANDETFEALLEKHLNEDGLSDRCSGYEVLNFAGAGRNPVQFLYRLENQVLDFDPDAVILVGHHQDKQILDMYLPRLVQSGVEVPYEYLRRILREEGIDSRSEAALIKRRLAPHQGEILDETYLHISAATRDHGLKPYWLLLPMVYDPQLGDTPAFKKRLQHMESLGFNVLSLADVYRGHRADELRLAPWDSHPNVRAHRLVAAKLYEILKTEAEIGPGK